MRRIFTLFFCCLALQSFAQDSTSTKKQAVIIDVNAGSGLRLGKAAPGGDLSMQNYAEQLRNGFVIDASLYFPVKPGSNHMLGLKFNSFRKKAEVSNVYITFPDGSTATGKMSDDTRLTFYGFSYMYADHGTRNSQWSIEASLGYMSYRDIAVLADQDFDIKGGTIGALVGAGYYFRITNGLYLGPKLNLLVGSVKKVHLTGSGTSEDIKLENPESLARLDITAGLRIEL